MNRTICFRLVLVAVLTVLTLMQAFPAAAGLTKIADNVYSYVGVSPAGPQNSFGANAGIVIGQDGILVVDTLISAKEAKRFIKDIRAISQKPIKFVVNTHYHLDHAFGNSEFNKLGAIIISQENDRRSLATLGPEGLKNIKNYGLSEQDMAGTTIVSPALGFSDRLIIDLGGQLVELVHTMPSHTSGSVMVIVPDKKIVFAGDVLFTDMHPFLAEGDLDGWNTVLDSLLALDGYSIIPGHGPLSGKKDVLEMQKYLTTFDTAAKDLAQTTQGVEAISAALKKVLPPRSQGDFLIKANIQLRYLKK